MAPTARKTAIMHTRVRLDKTVVDTTSDLARSPSLPISWAIMALDTATGAAKIATNEATVPDENSKKIQAISKKTPGIKRFLARVENTICLRSFLKE